jgi:hypothetical protein
VIDREQYAPGPASGAQVRKDGEKWTLILVRELRHSPEKVWQALTDPAHLRERWELEAFGGGTRLTLWTNIDRRFISMGAAGWHICFDVLDHLLGGTPIGRIVGPDAMKFGGWQRLNAEYAKQFGVETPGWSTDTPKR